jgi:hypothetical protein
MLIKRKKKEKKKLATSKLAVTALIAINLGT